MRSYVLPTLLIASAIALVGRLDRAPSASGRDKPARPTPEDISKDWGFSATTLKAAGKVATGVQSNGDKLRWYQITATLDDLSYAEAFARVVKFYADRCGSDFAYNPKLMQVGQKGESKRGRFIFSEVRPDPRELSFVFDATDYTVSGVVRPAPAPGKDAVEVILTIAIR
jgi:hypothetical protein